MSFEDWAQVLGSMRLSGALLDRLPTTSAFGQ